MEGIMEEVLGVEHESTNDSLFRIKVEAIANRVIRLTCDGRMVSLNDELKETHASFSRAVCLHIISAVPNVRVHGRKRWESTKEDFLIWVALWALVGKAKEIVGRDK